MTEAIHTRKTRIPQGFMSCQFDEIEEPGVYVTQRGEMFRVPPEALAEGHSPLLLWESNEGRVVTRINSDPYAPISKCRQLAADADLHVNF
jgi:hypothetical protein